VIGLVVSGEFMIAASGQIPMSCQHPTNPTRFWSYQALMP
jgi:hypothetical protein